MTKGVAAASGHVAPARMRAPVGATLAVALAVAAMLALGWWQLAVRLPQKEAYLAQLAGNPRKPPIAYPTAGDDRLLFRRTRVRCAASPPVRLAGAGAAGFRAIADCPAGALGPQAFVQLGTTRDPNARITFGGGWIGGYLAHAPDARPMLAGLWDHTPPPFMLVADRPGPGLAPNAPPDLDAVPNNHLAYGVQWFFFAGVAVVIYTLALRRRLQSQARP